MGVRVWKSMGLPEDVSGKIFRDPIHGGTQDFSIVVNGRHAAVRQRFTVAHELAHFILHRGLIGDGMEEDALYRSDRLSDRQEIEANRLAAEILMPWHLINRYTGKAADELARIFEVSAEAMRIRIGPNAVARDLARRLA